MITLFHLPHRVKDHGTTLLEAGATALLEHVKHPQNEMQAGWHQSIHGGRVEHTTKVSKHNNERSHNPKQLNRYMVGDKQDKVRPSGGNWSSKAFEAHEKAVSGSMTSLSSWWKRRKHNKTEQTNEQSCNTNQLGDKCLVTSNREDEKRDVVGDERALNHIKKVSGNTESVSSW
jgi:hypothetical protein